MPNEKYEVGLVFRAFDKVTGPIKNINASLKNLQSPIRNLNNAFVAFKEASGINRVASSFARVGGAIRGVGSELFSLGTKFVIFGGLAAAALGKAITSSTESADKIAKLNKASGLGVEAIQTLGFAFEQSGGSPESFNKSVIQFAKTIGELQSGTGSMITILKKMDPAFLKQMTAVENTDDALRSILTRISNSKTEFEALALASAAFGKKNAQAMVVLAKEGVDGIEKLEAAKRKIGVLTPEQVFAAEPLNDQLNELFKSLTFLKDTIVLSIAPVLTDVFDKLTWYVSDNKEAVKEWAQEFARELPGRLRQLKAAFTDLWAALKPARDLFNKLTENSDKFKVGLGIIAAIITGPLIASVLGLVGSLILLSNTLLTSPIGWIIGLLGLGALQFYAIGKAAELTGNILVAAFKDAPGYAMRFLNVLVAIGDILSGGPIARLMTGGKAFNFPKIDILPATGNVGKAWKKGVKWTPDWVDSIQKSGSPALDADTQKIIKETRSQSTQVITRDSEITIRFANIPAGTQADVTRNDGNKIKVNMPLGSQSVGRPA